MDGNLKRYAHRLGVPLGLFLLVVAISVAGFRQLEGLSWLDSLWLTMITILTVGYGDIVPGTDPGRLFAMVMIPLSILALTYLAGEWISTLLEINLLETRERKLRKKMLENCRDHIILCGAGPMLEEVIHKLREEGADFVMVDRDREALEPFGSDGLILAGDPTEEHVLEEAGILRARGLITLMHDDAENLLVIFTARGLSEKLNIVSMAAKEETARKLKKAGADKVIHVNRIGGYRAAMSVLRPATTEFVESVLTSTGREVRVEEVVLPEGSSMEGLTLKESMLRENHGINVLALKRDSRVISAPKPTQDLQAGDILVVFGSHARLDQFKMLLQR